MGVHPSRFLKDQPVPTGLETQNRNGSGVTPSQKDGAVKFVFIDRAATCHATLSPFLFRPSYLVRPYQRIRSRLRPQARAAIDSPLLTNADLENPDPR